MTTYQKYVVAAIHRKSRSIDVRVRTKTWLRGLTTTISNVTGLSQCHSTLKEINLCKRWKDKDVSSLSEGYMIFYLEKPREPKLKRVKVSG